MIRVTNADLRRLGIGTASPVKRGMNAMESEYAHVLECQRQRGEIEWWGYECFRLRLAFGAWYKPDFAVITVSGELEFHETKGFFREAANVRLKVAAERYPFLRFYLVRKSRKAWDVKLVS